MTSPSPAESVVPGKLIKATVVMVPKAPPLAVQVKLPELDADPDDAAPNEAVCLLYPLPDTSFVKIDCSRLNSSLC
jgi:hypothetical protein